MCANGSFSPVVSGRGRGRVDRKLGFESLVRQRLQKILARAGVASRRRAEDLIVAGRVRVDGRVETELGVQADPRKSTIELDGKRLVLDPFVYLVLHKPRGVVCTLRDPEGRKSVSDLIQGLGVRVVPVGRLDFHTSGALLFTNDGDFAKVLQHPSGGAVKQYVAKVKGELSDRDVEAFRRSILISGRPTRPAKVKRLRTEGGKTWLEIELSEGKNRQIRRLGESAGFPVMRLVRTAQAGITTAGLRPGQWRHLTRDELVELKHRYGVPARTHATLPSQSSPKLEERRARARRSVRRRRTAG